MSKTALFKASKSWDARWVGATLALDGSLVNARDARGRTALHLCAGHPLERGESPAESLQTAEVLLKGGADVNAIHEIPDDGEVFPATPLWYAVARGLNRELVKLLLANGADPDYCLWACVWASDVETARLLLRAGSRTELKFDGETPLLYAARLGREAMVLELIRAKADVRARDSKGLTALDHARKKRLGAQVIDLLRGS